MIDKTSYALNSRIKKDKVFRWVGPINQWITRRIQENAAMYYIPDTYTDPLLKILNNVETDD